MIEPSRRNLITGATALAAYAWLPVAVLSAKPDSIQPGDRTEAPQSPMQNQVGSPFSSSDPVPTWLPDPGTLPVVRMDEAASRAAGRLKYKKPSGSSGYVVEIPAGDWRDLTLSFYPKGNQRYNPDSLVVFRCKRGLATFGRFSGANQTRIRQGLILDGIGFDRRGQRGLDLFRPTKWPYVKLQNFVLTGTDRNGVATTDLPGSILHIRNGEIHHVGGAGKFHGVYAHPGDLILIENVHVHSIGASDRNNGGHCLKLYARDVQVFNCRLEQAGDGEPTTNYPGHHGVFAPLDIGAYGQSTIAGNRIVRNSDQARNEIMAVRNRYFRGYPPNLDDRPYRHLFAFNSVVNSSIKPGKFALWNNGTWPGRTHNAPADWQTTYADWSNQDCVIYHHANTGLDYGRAIGNTQPWKDSNTSHTAPIIEMPTLERWARARLS